MYQLTAYHGTGESLDRVDLNRGSVKHPDGLGAWFTECNTTACDFARDRSNDGVGVVYQSEIKMGNPWIVNSFEQLQEFFHKFKGDAQSARSAILDTGYDGIIIDRSLPPFKDDARDIIVIKEDTIASVKRIDAVPAPGPGR